MREEYEKLAGDLLVHASDDCGSMEPPETHIAVQAATAIETLSRENRELREALDLAASRLLMASINEVAREESALRYEYAEWAEEARTTLGKEGPTG